MVGKRLGPYEIEARLGAGGMGEVYRARDTRLGRDVAIKVLPPELAEDPGRLHRFEQEAKATAALAHPNVLALYDVGTHHGKPYLVEELLEGETLRARLRAGPLTPRKATEIAIAIAHGLAAAHAKGIVHRDLKPENVFLTRDGGVKILDFGLAKLAEPQTAAELATASTVDRETRTGAVLGTLGYLSPEQARGQTVDARSDLFAFGCLLHEMLAGERPFQGHTPLDLVSSLLRDDPPELPASVPAPLANLVVRCLEKQPEDRPSSAHDLALWLAGLAAPSPSPGKTPPSRVVGRPSRKLVLGGLSPVLLALVGGLYLAAVRPWRTDTEPATPSIRSIAVLPLDNLSGNPEDEPFADAMTEALILELARIPGFEKVISRTSVMGYKSTRRPLPEIGRELAVEGVLEGSVQRTGGRIRINVQLIDTRTDAHRWAESFDREAGDVLQLQTEIARSVAAAVEIALAPAHAAASPSLARVDPEDYEDYARAIAPTSTDEQSLLSSIALLESLTSRRPSFAQAWLGLFRQYRILAFQTRGDPSLAWAHALRAGERYLDLAPDSAESHTVRGWIAVPDWRWEVAEREFRAAVAIEPANAEAVGTLAHHLIVLRRFDEGLALADRSITFDPNNPARRRMRLWYLNSSGQFDLALLEARRLEPVLPNDRALYGWMAAAAIGAGKLEEAVTLSEQLAALVAGNETPYYLCKLTWGFGRAGRPARARHFYEKLEALAATGSIQPMFLAIARIGIEDLEGALDILERGVDEHALGMHYLNSNSELDPLRSNPRFKALLCRMRFPGACSVRR